MTDLKIGDYVRWIGRTHTTQPPLFGRVTEVRGSLVWVETDQALPQKYWGKQYSDAPDCWELSANNARLVADAADSAAYYEALTEL